MPSNNFKTDGETLIRHLVARTRTRLRKYQEQGKKFDEPVISIPLLLANDIAERSVKRKDKIETIVQILGEISFRIEDEETIKVSKINTLVERALIIASEIK